jgi:hypothetical protein
MRNLVLFLGSQATVDLFCIPKLVTDVKQKGEHSNLAANAGSLIASQKAKCLDKAKCGPRKVP